MSVNNVIDNYIKIYNQLYKQTQPQQDILRQLQFMPTTKVTNEINDTISQLSSYYSHVITQLSVEDFIKKTVESYKIWGSLGWSVIPTAPMKLFNKMPTNKEEADKIALKFLDEAGIKKILQELKEQDINQDDLESLVACLKIKQYKPCALVIVGMIDAQLIELQSSNSHKKRRKVGNSAIKELENNFSNDSKSIGAYCLFYITCLLESLKTFFANGNDFLQEPEIINRNFISHGMNIRKVTEKDCIQLLLALYNLLMLSDMIINDRDSSNI